MSLFFETIKYHQGEFFLLDYHEDRLNKTRFSLGAKGKGVSLSAVLQNMPLDTQLYRCRVSYDQNITKVEYFPYSLAIHKTLALMDAGDFEYHFKAENRVFLNDSVAKSGQSDVIFLK